MVDRLLQVLAAVRARVQLRKVTSVGSRTRVWGRVRVRIHKGRIDVGSRVRFDAKVVPIEIGVADTGHLVIGDSTYINYGTSLASRAKVTIGRDCLIGTYVMINDADYHRIEPDRRHEYGDPQPVTIGDNVWLGARVIVLKGVTIGENSVVGAGSVVTGDIPPNTIYAGNPARHLRDL